MGTLRTLVLLASVGSACSGGGSVSAVGEAKQSAPRAEEAPVGEHRAPAPAADPACPDPVALLEGGRIVGRACPRDAEARGLTVIDLSNDWVPRPGRSGSTRAVIDSSSPGRCP